MEVKKAKGCLSDFILPCYWLSLVTALFYLGSILSLLLGWSKGMPRFLAQSGPNGIALPIWFYAVKLGLWIVIWLGSGMIYVLRRWGLVLFSLGFIGLLVVDLVFRSGWIISAVMMIFPVIVILIARGYVFQHRSEELPATRELGAEDEKPRRQQAAWPVRQEHPKPRPGRSNPGTKKDYKSAMIIIASLVMVGSMVMCGIQGFSYERHTLLSALGYLLFGISAVALTVTFLLSYTNKQEFAQSGCATISFLITGIIAAILGSIMLIAPESKTAQTVIINSTRRLRAKEFMVDVIILPEVYRVGDEGMLTILIENNSEKSVMFSNISLRLPRGFFDGFDVIYPTDPPHEKVSQGGLGGSSITFSGGERLIAPGEAFFIQVPIAAKKAGDYSGRFQVTPLFSPQSEALAIILDSEKIDLSVSPAAP